MTPEVNERRIAAIRRHRSNPLLIAHLKVRIRKLLLKDEPSKVVASHLGISPTNACKWAHVLGFRRMYVTKEERAHLLKRRTRNP